MRIFLAFLCMALPLTSPTLSAEPKPLWELGLGVLALHRPDYLGADEQTLYLLPFPNVVYRGDWLKADDDGIHGLLFNSKRWELDISGGGSLPVNSKDNSAREGMDDLDPAFELGPSLTYKWTIDSPNRITSHLKTRALISIGDGGMHYQGWVFNPEFRWEFQQRAQLRWGATLQALYGSADYHGFFHNVAPEFVMPQRARYAADAGYGGTALSGFVRWQPAPEWTLFSSVTYHHLGNVSFDDGPLFRQKYGLYLSFGLSRTLFKSTTLVP
ncbi:MAG: outer membrane protein [Paracoccaceae bacterium]